MNSDMILCDSGFHRSRRRIALHLEGEIEIEKEEGFPESLTGERKVEPGAGGPGSAIGAELKTGERKQSISPCIICDNNNNNWLAFP